MTLLLDTSVLIAIEKKEAHIKEKLNQIRKQHQTIPAISLITYTEMITGYKKREIKNQEKAIGFLNNFTFLPATKETATILANLKYTYDQKGNTPSLADLFIAAQAKEHHLTLITKDKDFERIDEIDKIILA
ncbi:hypothetical protein CMI48_01025 [Candidatus Pacearchaeota archaeon]|nr:hypothetical protein [Candidatus Pacearchaeota archaeon]